MNEMQQSPSITNFANVNNCIFLKIQMHILFKSILNIFRNTFKIRKHVANIIGSPIVILSQFFFKIITLNIISRLQAVICIPLSERLF